MAEFSSPKAGDKRNTNRQRDTITGWVLYASMGVDAADFWAQYDHIYIPELGHNVSVTDYAHTLYIRASWTDFNPQEDVYGWKIDSNLRVLYHCSLYPYKNHKIDIALLILSCLIISYQRILSVL